MHPCLLARASAGEARGGGRFHCRNVNDHNCSRPSLLTRYLHLAKKDDHRSRYSAFTVPSSALPPFALFPCGHKERISQDINYGVRY